MRATSAILLQVALVIGCINPSYHSEPAEEKGFRCWPSDTPACPPGLVCCDHGLCGDALRDKQYGWELEGWCVQSPLPIAAIEPSVLWDFGSKLVVKPAVKELGLDKIDPVTNQWGCPRNDPAKQEPNDTPDSAIQAGTLVPDNIPNWIAYEICPAQDAPQQPDIDVIKFSVAEKGRIVIQLNYDADYGDLDVALFASNLENWSTERPQLVKADLGVESSACVEQADVMPGIYYAVVRGAPVRGGGT